jgi:hypothetical protein
LPYTEAFEGMTAMSMKRRIALAETAAEPWPPVRFTTRHTLTGGPRPAAGALTKAGQGCGSH